MGERARIFALAICLLLLAVVLAGLSAGLSPSTHSSAAITIVPRALDSGTLLVKVVAVHGTTGGIISSSVDVPVADANVTLSGELLGAHAPVFQTNSSGEVQTTLPNGSYTVSLSDPQFQNATSIIIQEKMTTEVDATVTQHSYSTMFSDIPDSGSSGAVAPWSYLSVAVNSSLAPALNRPLFIFGTYGGSSTTIVTATETSPGTGTPDQSVGQGQVQIFSGEMGTTEAPTLQATLPQVPVVVISSSSSGDAHILWLTLEPESFFPVSGLVSLDLAAYAADLLVTTYGT